MFGLPAAAFAIYRTAKLKALGAAGVLTVGNNMQAIFGPRYENLMTDMKEYLKTANVGID